MGALYIRKGTKVIPQIIGGHQERNKRAGTENIPGIVGMGKAFEITKQSLSESKLSSADYTLFLGCTQIYRESEEIDSLLKILRAAGVSFRIPNEQICCGSPAYRVGDEFQAFEQAKRITTLFESMQSDKILVS